MPSVHTVVNAYRLSNTFIVESGKDKVALIDVGGPDISQIREWLVDRRKQVEAVLLTHEHADHCVGVNALFEAAPFPIYCSQKCAQNIANSRQNFSFYVEEIPTFEIRLPVNIVADNSNVQVGGLSFVCIETPGHSPGGMCYMLDHKIFTGDTILNNVKSPLTFPHSNRTVYATSVQRLASFLTPGVIVYPGHGESFIVTNLEDIAAYSKDTPVRS